MDKQKLLQAKDFIFADIEREIALADASQRLLGRFWLRRAKVQTGGGNFMTALALLSYTEFAGRLNNNDFTIKNSKKNFDDFFENLGPSYKQFLYECEVYKIFRCGLAHEYYVKQDCIIAVRSPSEVAIGIGFDNAHKQYVFIIEPYFRDFKNAFDVLCQKLK